MADARPLRSVKKKLGNVEGDVNMNQCLKLLALFLLVAVIAGCSTVMNSPLDQPSALFAPAGELEQEIQPQWTVFNF